jgi:uncharacterized ubiquitin-like protein YukD
MTLKHNEKYIKEQLDVLYDKKTQIKQLIDQLAQEYSDNQKEIEKLEVKLLNKDEILTNLAKIIKEHSQTETDMNNKGIDIYRVYSDGTLEFCRNTFRNNWHELEYNIIKNVPKELSTLFPNSLSSGETFVSVNSSYAIQIRSNIELLAKIYKN